MRYLQSLDDGFEPRTITRRSHLRRARRSTIGSGSGRLPCEVQFSLWWTTIGAIGGFALPAGLYFVVVVFDLTRLATRITGWTVTTWLVPALVLGVVGSVAFATGPAVEPPLAQELTAQTRPFTAGTALLLLPGLMAFFVVRSIARTEVNWSENDRCQVVLVRRLRDEVRHLLTVFGAFLALLVVATGLRRQALLVHDDTLVIPSEQVLMYGLVFAGMLAFFYLSTSSAIDDRATQIVDRLVSLPDPGAPDLSDRMQRRSEVAALVGSGGSWRTFETSVVVAAPLLTGLLATATR